MDLNKKIFNYRFSWFYWFHLCLSYLEDGFEVIGIDNINDYYCTKLKNNRLNKLYKYKNFTFLKVDIANFEELKNVFEKFNFNIVINLAAQAGVRYSIENPFAYLNSNFIGFLNIIELCKNFEKEGLIYASSSSVYGSNKKIPFDVNDRVDNPISLYAASKRSNELVARSYSHLFGLKTTGLRFFTVYGPWGRPDMAMYIFANKIYSSEPIDLYNNGNMKRDFTYIDDIILGVRLAVEKNYACEVFNLGNNKSEDLMDIVKCIEKNLKLNAKINFLPMQPGDVEKTHANIDKSIEMLGFKPSVSIKEGIKNFIDWYLVYNEYPKNRKICLVGIGKWGINHANTLYELGILSGIVEPNKVLYENVKNKFIGVNYFTNISESLDFDFDGYVVATPAETHFLIAKQIIESGKHLLVEKPLTTNLDDAIKLNQLAKLNNVNLMVGHVLIFHPAFKKIKKLIENNILGDLQYMYSNRLNLGTIRTHENVLWSFAPHDIALFQYFSDLKPIKIDSSGIDIVQKGIHDTTITAIKYPNNIMGHIFVSWLHPFKEHRFVVVGSKGMIHFEDSTKEKPLVFYSKNIKWEKNIPTPLKGESEIIEFENSPPLELN